MVLRISEDQVFDLMADLVEFASARGLPQTAAALEGALDAYLQDRGLAPRALPPPVSEPGPAPVARSRGADATADAARVRPDVLVAIGLSDPALGRAPTDPDAAEFQSRRAMPRPRRLHLLPTQRVPG